MQTNAKKRKHCKKTKNWVFHKSQFFSILNGICEVWGCPGWRHGPYEEIPSNFHAIWSYMASESPLFGNIGISMYNTRNGPRNLPFCPGSLRDTFIIYSSISHQHIFPEIFVWQDKIGNRQIGNLKMWKSESETHRFVFSPLPPSPPPFRFPPLHSDSLPTPFVGSNDVNIRISGDGSLVSFHFVLL